MTLLDDLQALDLSAILDAKADISVTIDAESLQALVGAGATTSVLGEVGTVIQAAVDGFEHPETLIAPLLDALSAVLDEIDTGIEIGDYVDAVTAAARIVAELVGMISGDPNRIGFGGTDVGTALERVAGQFGDHAAVVSGGIARFRSLVDMAERGLPSDPTELIGPALEILLPFPTTSVDAVRTWALQLAGRLDDVAIDPHLTDGLVDALAQVRVAAEAGDVTAIATSLDFLGQVRANTVAQLAAALRSVAGTISGIRVDDGVTMLRDLRGVLAGADDSVLDVLDQWRQMIAGVRATVETIDANEALEQLDAILDEVEATAHDALGGAVDDAVEIVKQWLRDLLREVPIRPLRLQLSQAISEAAKAIADADLDAPADAIRSLLTEVSGVLTEADPTALVQSAVDELEGVIRDALDQLADALGRITRAIDDVADQAEQVLQRAVDGVRDFSEVVDEITVAVEQAGIVDAANEIAETLHDLREQVSDLLSNAPVPDALREMVGQLISTLESVDLDAAVGGPLREVAAQLQIPDDVATTVNDGLRAVADAIQSLVPTDVIADLEAMMNDVLTEIEQLDISELTSGITELLDGAATVFDDVRIAELVAPAADVFAEIVDAIDQVHPRVILRPAIDLYAQILGSIPLPSPDAIASRAGAVTAQAGEAIARTAAEPARRVVDSSATTPPAGESPRGGLGPAPEDPPDDLKPGDIVRLIGFLPAKLREGLAGLGAGPLGDVLAAIDDVLGVAAAALRDVRDRIVELDTAARRAFDAALAPLTAAQIDAQLAMRASLAFQGGGGAGGTVDLDVSLSLVAAAGPGSLAAELAGEQQLIDERCRIASASLSGRVADDLDQVAELLVGVLPSDLLADADAFLAALDPEPIAADFDALLASIVDATPAFLTAVGDELRGLEARIRALLAEFNPGRLMQRFLGILDVVREELSLLDPGRLADELSEVHAEIKAAVVAYDPVVLAGELDALVAEVAVAIRSLDPAGLMPDLSGITAQVARVGDILPINALAGVGEQLTVVGDELRALDVQGMLDAVNALTPEIVDAITILIDTVRDEIVALLESIRYTSTSGSASVSVGVG